MVRVPELENAALFKVEEPRSVVEKTAERSRKLSFSSRPEEGTNPPLTEFLSALQIDSRRIRVGPKCRQYEPPTGPQDSANLDQQPLGILHVAQKQRRQCPVK